MSRHPIGVRNILAVWYQATPEERLAGEIWYHTAGEIAQRIAHTYGTTREHAAGVLAALSPGVSWHQNVIGAEALLQHVQHGGPDRFLTVQGYPTNVKKALRIARGAFGGTFQTIREAFDENTAPKTRAFYSCILALDSEVCVDGHAVSIHEGERFGVGDPRANLWAAKYRRIAGAYRTAAAEVSEAPHVVQAVTWVAWHRIHDIRDGTEKL